MRREVRTTEKVITTKELVYIAEDGREFKGMCAANDCNEYEREIARKDLDKLEIEKLEGYVPINIDFDHDDYESYWFKINNEEDWNAVSGFYNAFFDFYCNKPKSYPEILCVVEFETYSNGYFLSETIDEVKKFFKLFGIECELKGEPK